MGPTEAGPRCNMPTFKTTVKGLVNFTVQGLAAFL